MLRQISVLGRVTSPREQATGEERQRVARGSARLVVKVTCYKLRSRGPWKDRGPRTNRKLARVSRHATYHDSCLDGKGMDEWFESN